MCQAFRDLPNGCKRIQIMSVYRVPSCLYRIALVWNKGVLLQLGQPWPFLWVQRWQLIALWAETPRLEGAGRWVLVKVQVPGPRAGFTELRKDAMTCVHTCHPRCLWCGGWGTGASRDGFEGGGGRFASGWVRCVIFWCIHPQSARQTAIQEDAGFCFWNKNYSKLPCCLDLTVYHHSPPEAAAKPLKVSTNRNRCGASSDTGFPCASVLCSVHATWRCLLVFKFSILNVKTYYRYVKACEKSHKLCSGYGLNFPADSRVRWSPNPMEAVSKKGDEVKMRPLGKALIQHAWCSYEKILGHRQRGDHVKTQRGLQKQALPTHWSGTSSRQNCWDNKHLWFKPRCCGTLWKRPSELIQCHSPLSFPY